MDDKREGSSHAEALKSTSIIGGSTAITILIRMVRTKVLAILLGPAGIGLEAIYDSVISLARIGVDMGISSSGVRQIASAVGSGSQSTIAATVFTLRRVCLLLGLMGTAALFLTREQVSKLAFGNADHAFDIGLLSVILLFVALTGGQGALLQGMRRIGDLAKMNILGTAIGAALSIPIVYIWGRQGIPAYMVLTAAVGALISWSYARRVPSGIREDSFSTSRHRGRKPVQAGPSLCLDRTDVSRRSLPTARFRDPRGRRGWSGSVSSG